MSTAIKTMDETKLAEEIVSVVDGRVARVCSDDRENVRFAVRGAMKLRSVGEVKTPNVVSTAPTMVTNMTGFLIISRGSSFLNESAIAGPTIFQSKREGALWVIESCCVFRNS